MIGMLIGLFLSGRIYIIGDSHANSYRGISGVTVHYLGAVTLKRMGYKEDVLLPYLMDKIKFKPDDIVLFSFGEIDVRCHVKPRIERGKDLDAMLKDWVKRYCDRIREFGIKNVGVISVTPPTSISIADTVEHPVRGSDEERILYTQKINKYLKEQGLIYLDTYSIYQKDGMLPRKFSDGTVHIKDKKGLKNLLAKTKKLLNMRPQWD
jgi:hypothetical protein